MDYNKKNGIEPKTILKSIDQISLSTSVADEREDELRDIVESKDIDINIDCLDDLERKDIIQNLNKKMKSAAKQMKFEVAALYRDKINQIKQGAAK